MKLHEPQIFTDGGPWATHDYACPVFKNQHAVLDMNKGIFTPSWAAQKEGWKLVHAKTGFQRWILRTFFNIK